eukprot:6123145-Prorocentrum_lima.AAC.1
MTTSNFGQGHDSGNESPELPPRVEEVVDDQPQYHQQQQLVAQHVAIHMNSSQQQSVAQQDHAQQ